MNFLRPVTGRVYFSPVENVGTLLAAHSTLYALPFNVAANMIPDQIGINVTTAGAGANCEVRLGIYEDNRGRPGALIVDAGTITGLDSTGGKTASLVTPHPLMLFANQNYWLAALFRQAATTQPTVAAATAAAQSDIASSYGVADMASLPSAAAGIPNGYAIGAQTFGPLLATFPAGNLSLNAAIPLVGLRAA